MVSLHVSADGNRSAVGVLVERNSRLVMLTKKADSTAPSALEDFIVLTH